MNDTEMRKVDMGVEIKELSVKPVDPGLLHEMLS